MSFMAPLKLPLKQFSSVADIVEPSNRGQRVYNNDQLIKTNPKHQSNMKVSLKAYKKYSEISQWRTSQIADMP